MTSVAGRPATAVINADDLGLFTEVNDAIFEAHEAGTVTSATLLVNADASAEAVRALPNYPRLGIGLHFNLTFGVPVSDAAKVETLVDKSGRFLSRRALAMRALTGGLVSSHVEQELESQLAACAAFGLTPSHIDGHQHVQVLPVIAAVVARVAKRLRLPVRIPWVRWRPVLSRTASRAALSIMCKHARRSGVPGGTDAFTSVFDYPAPERVNSASYARMLDDARGESVEIMVHPAHASARLAAIHPLIYDVALAESRVLSDPATALCLADTGVRLGTFETLSGAATSSRVRTS